jgi:biotin transport system substrate-specific component
MIQTKVLADRLITQEGLAWDALRVAAANLLLVACAQVAIPLPWSPVPLTGQTFGVMFVAATLGARRGALALVLYLVEGAMGLPVFQPFGAPGAARLLGPTAGYLWAYPVAAFVVGWLVERGGSRSAWGMMGALLAGECVTLASGWAWLAVVPFPASDGTAAVMGWKWAFWTGVAPFLVGDLVKTALVVAAVRGIERSREGSEV